MYKDITAAILAGGKSSRMGKNKSLLKIGEFTVIETIIDKLKLIFENVILITNEPELYTNLSLPHFVDIFQGKGPLAGIHSGLFHSKTEKNFIISCDIPLITSEAIDFIVNYPTEKTVSLPFADGFVQELCGLYNKSLIHDIEMRLLNDHDHSVRHSSQEKRKCSVHGFIESVGANIIDFEKEYPAFNKYLFFNMNTQDDYRFVLENYK